MRRVAEMDSWGVKMVSLCWLYLLGIGAAIRSLAEVPGAVIEDAHQFSLRLSVCRTE